jgi:IS5 family transposase
LQQLNTIVNWEAFRPTLDVAIPREKSAKGGRPPFDNLFMFKVLIIKRLYNLSLAQTEYQINDRISFMRFLGIDLNDRVPDANTVWVYEEALSKSEAGRSLFDVFFGAIEEKGYVTREGTIIDATFIESPKRKNSKEQREKLKNGEIPEEWVDPEHPQKLSQRDTDATWAKKSNVSHFGFGDSVKIDVDSKIITGYNVTVSSANDAVAAQGLLDETDNVVYADAAYPTLKVPKHIENRINESPTKGHHLSEEQKANNHIKSKTRCRIEHVFAGMVQMAGGTNVRCKSMNRAVFHISLLNLVYNMRRVLSLECPTENWIKRKKRMAMG